MHGQGRRVRDPGPRRVARGRNPWLLLQRHGFPDRLLRAPAAATARGWRFGVSIETVAYEDGAIALLDQTLLPGEVRVLRITRLDELCEAIRSLRVRGAPALGVRSEEH